jgi:hypothetical protein
VLYYWFKLSFALRWLSLWLTSKRQSNPTEKYYNETRTDLSLDKDAPILRVVHTAGPTMAMPALGGLPINISKCEFPTGTAVPATR